jgi:hypothetical protein
MSSALSASGPHLRFLFACSLSAAAAACAGESKNDGAAGGSANPQEDVRELCRANAVQDCASDSRCYTVEAQRWNVDRACWQDEREPQGCEGRDALCVEVVTKARSPEGDCWLFACEYLPNEQWIEDASCPDPVGTCGTPQ